MALESDVATIPTITALGAACFREVLAASGYNEAGLVETLGTIRLPARVGQDRAHLLHLTRRGRPLDTLIRLFLLQIPETTETVRGTLGSWPLEECSGAGLVRVADGKVHGLVRINAFRHLLLACDQAEGTCGVHRADAVMGITASTVALADAIVPLRSRSTLDLGTGNGVQAFLAAAHSERVWATDRSARATSFARFNATLNGLADKIEFAEGNAFEPVHGRTFDLILSNPPFAISPSLHYVYRDSGIPGDGFVRGVVENGARALNEDGFCEMVCNWAHLLGQDWKDRLALWFANTGCDVWVMRTDTQNIADYAHSWIAATEPASDAESNRLYGEWLGYYEREKIEAVSTGLILMRKASDRANWLRIEDGPEDTLGPFGECVLRGFRLRDFLESARTDEALLAAKLKIAPDARLDSVLEWEDSTWQVRSAKIRLTQGLLFQGNIDLRLANMVALCDGKRSLAEILQQTARALGAEVAKITPSCLELVRQLVERGFLIPAGK